VSTIVSIYLQVHMLTDAKIRSIKPGIVPIPTADGNGLTLYTMPNKRKCWRYRYRYNGNPTSITIGDYPWVGIKEARNERDEYKNQLKRGVNPKAYKASKTLKLKAENSFRSMFQLWFDRHRNDWAERTAKKNLAAFEKHIFPYMGDRVVSSITPLDILEVFRKMDDKGLHETLTKTRAWTSRVFQECVVLGIIQFDPTRDLPSDAFKNKITKHFATISNPDDVASLLMLLENYGKIGEYQVAEALNLAPHVFLRPGELVGIEWREVDFNNKVIRISAERMKKSRMHLVPMSRQVLSKFIEIKERRLSDKLVFPSPTKRGFSINAETLRAALRRMGVTKEQFTTHGFRGMASTALNEHGFRDDVIEVQLSHIETNKSRKAYNHAQYLKERRDMMQYWSDYLDKLKAGNLTQL